MLFEIIKNEIKRKVNEKGLAIILLSSEGREIVIGVEACNGEKKEICFVHEDGSKSIGYDKEEVIYIQ